MTFELYLVVQDDLLGVQELKCGNSAYCKIYYKKAHTPVMYTLAPPVVYYDSETTIWFDPKSTASLITDLNTEDMPFINAKIGGALMDFESTVTHESTFSSWGRNVVKGRVGDQPVSSSSKIHMGWETGRAGKVEQEMLHCTYDNQTCYEAKTVPVIHEVSSNTGFTTGGQNLTVTGHGFNSPNIVATLDGVPCVVTSYSNEAFSCEVDEAVSPSVVDVPTVGQHGIRKEIVDSSQAANNDYVSFTNFDDLTKPDWIRSESLSMQLESFSNVGDRLHHRFRGWFKAPSTTNYRFYQSCDDQCTLSIDTTPGSSATPLEILRTT